MNETKPLSSPIPEIPGSDRDDSTIIRPIANEAELVMVQRLTHDCYVSKGYASPRSDRRLVHYVDFDGLPQTTVVVAVTQGEIVGSISLTVDGPWGLTVEKDFKKYCDSLRYDGRSLSVIWRLVMKPNLRNASRQVLMALFKESVALMMLQGANTALLTVNPRHASMYERFFNMKKVALKGATNGLRNAPGVLLRGDIENLPQSWQNFVTPTKFHLAA